MAKSERVAVADKPSRERQITGRKSGTAVILTGGINGVSPPELGS
jgi:hypothetical protein